MGVELRNWRTHTLVSYDQHGLGLAIQQFYHHPFPKEEKETAFHPPPCWSVGAKVCSPKEGHVRVPHSYACSWVRTFALDLCRLVTYLPCRVDADLDIPAIAAIGWQSAGKSSLIEAISGITLPRASNTCTR